MIYINVPFDSIYRHFQGQAFGKSSIRDWFPAHVHIVLDFELISRESLFKKMRKRSSYFMLCSQTITSVALLTTKNNKSRYVAKN